MALTTAEQIYREATKLPAVERLKLVERIVHDLTQATSEGTPAGGFDWMAIRGIAPNLLSGEDAQGWVTSSRAEADRRLERR